MSTRNGFVPTIIAFAIWGVFPLYFHPLHEVSAVQLIAHRIVWSFVCVMAWMAWRKELPSALATLRNFSLLWRLTVTAMLITTNWLIYVWGVTHGHVVETSLGYFINPLVNIVLGVVLLSERLTRPQWIAVGLAAIGVAYLSIMAGRPPWIALALALSFGTYGLLRKVIKVEALPGLATETLVLLPLALGYLIWCEYDGSAAFGHQGPLIDVLLIGSGALTGLTLFLFAYGARLLPYSTVGLLQYIAPTLQLTCGVVVLHEPFERTRVLGFALTWAALLIYAIDTVRRSRTPAALTA
jgi:chloramphenicol-sensitive protein RarD